VSSRNTQRVALITGANRGIGLEAARQLARRGFRVIIASRDEGKGRSAAERIRADGGNASALALDVADSESVRNAARQFATVADRLDALINNAGVYWPDDGPPLIAPLLYVAVDEPASNDALNLEDVMYSRLPPSPDSPWCWWRSDDSLVDDAGW
jgi:NAD(P)-dependent dehydrogenase (short-subunit alcohol dehydrogenase family)